MNFSDWISICAHADVGTFVSAKAMQQTDRQQHWQLVTTRDIFFVKTMSKHHADVLLSEQHSLQAITATGTLRTPRVIHSGHGNKRAWLIMEWLTLNPDGDWEALAHGLFQLHQNSQAQFGWQESNVLGEIKQHNHQNPDWVSFYRSQRLLPQLQLAKQRGLPESIFQGIDAILDRLDCYFTHQPKPSLVHGDCWRGNVAFLNDATPVIFDPASSYADAHVDIAMSQLFQPFPDIFYTQYRKLNPTPDNWQQRLNLYQLYHLLQHFNQYGGTFLNAIQQRLKYL